MPNKLKIMQVLPDLNSGGVERGTIDIANYLADKGYTNFICSAGGGLLKEIRNKKIHHITLPMYSKNPFIMLWNILKIRKIIVENNINIVHARSRAPAWSCFFACKLTKAKFVTTFHAAYSIIHPIKRLYNSVMLKGDRVIAISHFIKKHIETRYHFKSDRLVTIERGIDLDVYTAENVTPERLKKAQDTFCKDLEPDTKILLVPGRFSRIKGHRYLLSALKYLKGKKIKCIIIGKLTDKQYDYFFDLEKYSKDQELNSIVQFCSEAYSDMPALYAISHTVICPSLEPEGFGRVIVEAQAMERVIIATNIGAPAYIIKDGKDGFLTSCNDASTFADIIERSLNMTKTEYDKITANGRKKVKAKYALETMCSKTLSVYKELLSHNDTDSD